jgi:hypothetical protein
MGTAYIKIDTKYAVSIKMAKPKNTSIPEKNVSVCSNKVRIPRAKERIPITVSPIIKMTFLVNMLIKI